MMIEDGTGSGSRVKITDENCMCCKAITIPFQQHVNEENEESFSIIVSKTPTAAGDCFLYLKNTSSDDLVITKAKLYAAADEFIQLKVGDTGTTVGGAANTPVNRNAGSGTTADCTCQDGVDITGLTGGSVVDDVFVDGATSMVEIGWESRIIIPKNSVASFYAVTGGIAIKMTVSILFHS